MFGPPNNIFEFIGSLIASLAVAYIGYHILVVAGRTLKAAWKEATAAAQTRINNAYARMVREESDDQEN